MCSRRPRRRTSAQASHRNACPQPDNGVAVLMFMLLRAFAIGVEPGSLMCDDGDLMIF